MLDTMDIKPKRSCGKRHIERSALYVLSNTIHSDRSKNDFVNGKLASRTVGTRKIAVW